MAWAASRSVWRGWPRWWSWAAGDCSGLERNEFESDGIDQAAVRDLELGDHRQGHERHRHERSADGRPQPTRRLLHAFHLGGDLVDRTIGEQATDGTGNLRQDLTVGHGDLAAAHLDPP